jgi:hypothetical protein
MNKWNNRTRAREKFEHEEWKMKMKIEGFGEKISLCCFVY